MNKMVEAVTPPNPAGGEVSRGQHSVPNTPDPTLLTIDSIRREIAMLENLTDMRLDAAEKLRNEKFISVDALMERAEDMRREQKSDTKAAVDAALDSQKEATTKMEKSISDQIASLRNNFETSIRGIHSNISDLKDRMTVIESVKIGQTEQKVESRAISAGQLAVFGSAMVVIVFVINLVLFFISRSGG